MVLKENQDHSITLEEAAKMTASYRKTITSSDVRAAAFGKKAITEILNQDGCIGMRMYYAKNDDGNITLVLVGMKEDGNDMYDENLAEWAALCPPFCNPSKNPLNCD